MIDYVEQREVFEQYLESNFTDVPIVFENSRKKPLNVNHVAVIDNDVDVRSVEMGSSIREISGLFTIAIFTELGSGTGPAKSIVKSLCAVFDTVELPGMTFGEPALVSAGPIQDRTLYQHNLNVPYSYFYGQDDAN